MAPSLTLTGISASSAKLAERLDITAAQLAKTLAQLATTTRTPTAKVINSITTAE